ncbi:hypothetical protein [Enterococcus faecium]|uniref:hypothetical protein n=1 Tax=Enterococcus faecium TaxID=1352 RepID=UPI0034DB1EFE
MKNKKVFDFIYILKDEWQKLEKEETALIYEEIERECKIFCVNRKKEVPSVE